MAHDSALRGRWSQLLRRTRQRAIGAMARSVEAPASRKGLEQIHPLHPVTDREKHLGRICRGSTPKRLIGRRRCPPMKEKAGTVLDQVAKLLPPEAQVLKGIGPVRVSDAPILFTPNSPPSREPDRHYRPAGILSGVRREPVRRCATQDPIAIHPRRLSQGSQFAAKSYSSAMHSRTCSMKPRNSQVGASSPWQKLQPGSPSADAMYC